MEITQNFTYSKSLLTLPPNNLINATKLIGVLKEVIDFRNQTVAKIATLPTTTSTGGNGTVTSVGLSMPSAFSVSNSPITGSGTIAITGAGTTGDYIDGTGAIQPFPPIAGGGIISLNGLSGTVQTFAVGTGGSDFNISSSGTVHTFNIPTASATKRGALSTADWTTFNNKGNGTVTNVAALSLGTTGTDLSSSVVNSTSSPVITLNVPTASSTNRGVLSSTDWSTFNNKVATTRTITINGTTQDLSANRSWTVSAGLPTTVGAIRFVYTESDLITAVADHASNGVHKIFVVNDIGLHAPIEIPHTTTSVNKQLVIDLCGNTLYDATSTGLTYMLGRKPVNQVEANGAMLTWSLVIRDGAFIGKMVAGVPATGTLLDIGATYNTLVENISFSQAQYAVPFKFCLMGTIRKCMAIDISNTAFKLGTGDWSGSSILSGTDQSNGSLIDQCRVYNTNGAFAAFSLQGSSGCICQHSISEGGTPDYHVIFDSGGASTVLDGEIRTMHIESIANIAGCKTKSTGGYVKWSGIYTQHPQVLFDEEVYSNGGITEVHHNDIPWFPSGSKLKKDPTGNNGIHWHFDLHANSFDPFNTANWATGSLPFYLYRTGVFGSGTPLWTMKSNQQININGTLF